MTRRELTEQIISKGLLVAAVALPQARLLALWEEGQKLAQQPLKPTPTEVLGPFYKKAAPHRAQLHEPGEPGFPLRVTGRVVNTRGEGVPDAVIEMWQADHAGRYDLKGYRYRTRLLLGAGQDYAVDTILPGHYEDRPAQHIHYLISAPGHRTLITQAYFATDPWFEGDVDRNYAKRGIVSHRELVRPVTLYEAPGAPRAAITFDICLERL